MEMILIKTTTRDEKVSFEGTWTTETKASSCFSPSLPPCRRSSVRSPAPMHDTDKLRTSIGNLPRGSSPSFHFLMSFQTATFLTRGPFGFLVAASWEKFSVSLSSPSESGWVRFLAIASLIRERGGLREGWCS